MSSYLTFDEYLTLSSLQQKDVLEVRDANPGFIEGRITIESGKFDAKFDRLYVVPLKAPYPNVVKGWLTEILDQAVYLKRGVHPSGDVTATRKAAFDLVIKQMTEASDMASSSWDIPLKQTADGSAGSAIDGSECFGYSEPSPYDWMDRQQEALRGQRD